jgi:hypothetical protein
MCAALLSSIDSRERRRLVVRREVLLISEYRYVKSLLVSAAMHDTFTYFRSTIETSRLASSRWPRHGFERGLCISAPLSYRPMTRREGG